MRNIIIISLLACSVVGVSAKTPTRASEGSLLFSYCGDYSRGLGTATPGTTEKAAIEVPAELAEKWAGSKLTQVYIGFGLSADDEISLFIADDVKSDPVYTQDATVKPNGWNIITLDTPYEISGEPFVVGYSSYINSASERPIGIDDNKNDSPYSSWIEIDGTWMNYAKYFGNVCIKLLLEGDSLPMNEVTLNSASGPVLVQAGTPFSVTINVTNTGVADVESVNATYSLGEEAVNVPQVSFPDGPVLSQQSGDITLSGLVLEETGMSLPLEITVNMVNGEENESLSGISATIKIDCAEKCYQQNMVVEEYTGTWCGWCPRGIVGMAYMEENYGEKGFVGIAVHYGDQMFVESYAPLAYAHYSDPGYPCATANRGEVFDPSSDTLEEYYNAITSLFAPATISVEAFYNDAENTLTATAVSEYAFDWSDAPYSIAFVITEDNVGPYIQDNNFSGGQLGEYLEGWSDKSFSAITFFNEVARDITDLYGVAGSVPTTVAARTPYTFSKQLPLENVEDIKNCKVIAMIIDNMSGLIVNGVKTSISGTTGVGELAEDADGVIRVYNPQGLKVLETKDASALKNLPKGIYIINGKKTYL